jgi:hypothetical protein
MWKDENFGIPNKALMRLLPRDAVYMPGDQRAFLSQFTVWTEDFQRELTIDEFPIVELCRTRKRTKRQLGMRQPVTGTRLVFEVNSEPVIHEETGDFLGGIVVFKDITEFTKQIAAQIQDREFHAGNGLDNNSGWTSRLVLSAMVRLHGFDRRAESRRGVAIAFPPR